MESSAPFTSLEGYNNDPLVLGTIMVLIVSGGLGFFVWEDMLRVKRWKGFSFYTKMVLTITAGLLICGAVFFLCVEYNNPATFGSMPLPQKVLNAMFQSVTLRTAGFASFNQGGLQDSSIVVSCVLMLIGGSSASTAGGLKTVTAALLLLSLRANLAGREQVTIRGRAISYRKVIDAMTLALIIVFLFMTGSILISLADGVPYLHAAFETASALGTVGVTVGITPSLSPVSHVILICLMYLAVSVFLPFSMALLTRSRYPQKSNIRIWTL